MNPTLTSLQEESKRQFEKAFPLTRNSPHHAERYFSFKDEHVLTHLDTLIAHVWKKAIETGIENIRPEILALPNYHMGVEETLEALLP